MSQARFWALCMVGALIAGGCNANGSKSALQCGPPGDAVRAGLVVVGGVEAWTKAHRVHAIAIVTAHDDQGLAYTDRQDQVIDLKARTLVATGHTAQGTWTAKVSAEEKPTFVTSGFTMDSHLQQMILSSLTTELYRVAGPLNFVFGPERPRSTQATRVAGIDVVRVGVGGDSRQAIAYYFDCVTHQLRYVTSGADTPAAKGTVAVYTYMMLGGGKAFPNTIQVVRIGQHVLLGDIPVLEIHFSNVTVD